MIVVPPDKASPGEKDVKLVILFRMVVIWLSSVITAAAGPGAGKVKVAKPRLCLSAFNALFNWIT